MSLQSTFAKNNHPDSSHTGRQDLVSSRLKHNYWTGARYETDYWVEARLNPDNTTYCLVGCTSEWTHSKHTRKFGNGYHGQKDTVIITSATFNDAIETIRKFNSSAQWLLTQNKGSKNPDGTKKYQVFDGRSLKDRFLPLVSFNHFRGQLLIRTAEDTQQKPSSPDQIFLLSAP